MLTACLVLPADVWISLHYYKIPLGHPKFLRNIFDNVEPFGHAVGVIVAALSVMLLDDRQWKAGFSVLSAGLGAGLAADVAKLLVGRVRPRNFDFDTLDVRATFDGFLPFFNGSSASQSFPSAHTATAFAMAVMLSSLYPRAGAVFSVGVSHRGAPAAFRRALPQRHPRRSRLGLAVRDVVHPPGREAPLSDIAPGT